MPFLPPPLPRFHQIRFASSPHRFISTRFQQIRLASQPTYFRPPRAPGFTPWALLENSRFHLLGPLRKLQVSPTLGFLASCSPFHQHSVSADPVCLPALPRFIGTRLQEVQVSPTLGPSSAPGFTYFGPPRALQVSPKLGSLERSWFHLFRAPFESSRFHPLRPPSRALQVSPTLNPFKRGGLQVSPTLGCLGSARFHLLRELQVLLTWDPFGGSRFHLYIRLCMCLEASPCLVGPLGSN